MITIDELGDKESIKRTIDLLRSISYHLSRNRLTSHDEYRVVIGMKDAFCAPSMLYSGNDLENQVFLDTSALCCRHNQRVVKLHPIHHIILDHFNTDLYTGMMGDSSATVKKNSLEPGIYLYKRSVTSKSRKWFKVLEDEK